MTREPATVSELYSAFSLEHVLRPVVVSFPTVPKILGVSPHGIVSAVGILIGLWLLGRVMARRRLPREAAELAAIWAVLVGIVGARLDYVISHPSSFSSPVAALELWNGGLALFGGLLAGSAAAVLVLIHKGVSALRIFDAAAVPMATAIAIGRIGDILLGDHLGRPVSGPWGLGFRIEPGSVLAPGFIPSPAEAPTAGESCADVGRFYAGCTYHMSAAYDLIAAALIAGALVLLTRRALHAPGLQITAFAYLYAGQRLALDTVRGIDERILFGLSGTQLLSIGIVLAAIIAFGLIARTARTKTRSDKAPAESDSTPRRRLEAESVAGDHGGR
ncbi:prolipoprotein diacylglyceryl transferase [Knoellia koreensis]|uniref:Phosphatidylglycerol--prolipoprotein diacylglyceryl transferase n=1 Tax=Knoellia koreensis TaxID=2730921 RepID=A0A849HDP1_9MICO|nr:prolipoprotein diacylglyceryl transferase family protein [Knoellia sp. DB2414S]NNM47846.1 hypothetical protein [Knoellia sp. DB2414S]